MVSMARRATSKLLQMMNAPGGLNANVAALAQAENVSFEVDPKGWTKFGRRLDGAAG